MKNCKPILCALGLVLLCVSAATAADQLTFKFKVKVLHSFTGGADGANPIAALIRDANGDLYGTTPYGGSSNCPSVGCGVVFKLDKTGKETVLHGFTGGAGDGGVPFGALAADPKRNLYGTTYFGGSTGCYDKVGCGVVFKLDKTGKETVLYSFTGTGGDGRNPYAGLVLDAAGNLYGTTEFGGIGCPGYGCGVVFKLDKTGKETVLYSFTGTGGDGAFPFAGLVRDTEGNLYGTTYSGGSGGGFGVVFKLDKTGNETVLYSFTGEADGGNPAWGYLVRDANGNLYGTTVNGGDLNCLQYGCGVVFKLDKTGNETVLHSFTGTGGDGAFPGGGLVRDAEGNSYGTTSHGGAFGCRGDGCGTVFKLDKAGKETVLHSFNGSTGGAYPDADVVRDSKGDLYGATRYGGSGSCFQGLGCGVVFKLTP